MKRKAFDALPEVLTVEQTLRAMLRVDGCVHVFTFHDGCLFGCDWYTSDIDEMVLSATVLRKAPEHMQRGGHGIEIQCEGEVLYLETHQRKPSKASKIRSRAEVNAYEHPKWTAKMVLKRGPSRYTRKLFRRVLNEHVRRAQADERHAADWQIEQYRLKASMTPAEWEAYCQQMGSLTIDGLLERDVQ